MSAVCFQIPNTASYLLLLYTMIHWASLVTDSLEQIFYWLLLECLIQNNITTGSVAGAALYMQLVLHFRNLSVSLDFYFLLFFFFSIVFYSPRLLDIVSSLPREITGLNSRWLRTIRVFLDKVLLTGKKKRKDSSI